MCTAEVYCSCFVHWRLVGRMNLFVCRCRDSSVVPRYITNEQSYVDITGLVYLALAVGQNVIQLQNNYFYFSYDDI